MNNRSSSLQIRQVKACECFHWCIEGWQLLIQKPLLFLRISGLCFPLLVCGFLADHLIINNFPIYNNINHSTPIAVSFVLPIILTSLAIAGLLLNHTQQPTLKLIIHNLWQMHGLRLIFIYVLFLLLISMACNYVVYLLPGFTQIIEYSMRVLLIILQFISFLAIPANVIGQGKTQPMHVFFYALKALLVNYRAFILLNIILILVPGGTLFIAIVASHWIGKAWTIIIYSIVLWLFVSWLGLVLLKMAEDMIQPDKIITSFDSLDNKSYYADRF